MSLDTLYLPSLSLVFQRTDKITQADFKNIPSLSSVMWAPYWQEVFSSLSVQYVPIKTGPFLLLDTERVQFLLGHTVISLSPRLSLSHSLLSSSNPAFLFWISLNISSLSQSTRINSPLINKVDKFNSLIKQYSKTVSNGRLLLGSYFFVVTKWSSPA